MLKISPLIHKISQYAAATRQGRVISNASSDVFAQTTNAVPRVETLPGVSSEFALEVEQQIKQFPKKWLSKLAQENYEVVISPTIFEAYSAKKVLDPAAILAEMKNSKGTFATTYSNPASGKNFFAFCDKGVREHTAAIVNHELSHGVVNIEKLSKNPDLLKAIKQDVTLVSQNRKLDTMPEKEKLLASHYFFNAKAAVPVDEIIADTIAWQQKGGGCYGSGLIGDVKNPNLMGRLFPVLTEKVRSFL